MEIKEFIQNFADQLDDTDVEVLTPETKFRELVIGAHWQHFLSLQW